MSLGGLTMAEYIKLEAAADVAPVVHGRWTVIENHGDFTVFFVLNVPEKLK